MLIHVEALKTQRDLYLAFRDLFARHDSECFCSYSDPIAPRQG